MNKNFTGSTRSAIDLVAETLRGKTEFFDYLEEMNEKFDIKDNIFCCGANYMPEEPSKGYYGEVATFNSLNEAFKDFNMFTQGIRIHEGKVSVGNLYAQLSDVQESFIIDLSNSTIV